MTTPTEQERLQQLLEKLDMARSGRMPFPVDEDAIEAEIDAAIAQGEKK